MAIQHNDNVGQDVLPGDSNCHISKHSPQIPGPTLANDYVRLKFLQRFYARNLLNFIMGIFIP